MNVYRQLALTFVLVVVSAQHLVSSESDVWKQTGPLGVSAISDIVVNSQGVLFLGTNSGIFRSTDDAKTWVSLSEGIGGGAPWIEKIVLNSRGDIFVTVAYEGGVWRSTDGGNSWKRQLGGTVRALANNAHNDLFAGIQGVFGRNNSIYRSTDNGENWALINKGIPGRIVQAIAVNPDGHILAGTNEHGLFKSIDNGDSWTPIDFDLDVKEIHSIAINKRGHIYVITNPWANKHGILRSSNNGETWTDITTNLMPKSAFEIYIDSDENIYALTRKGLFRSIDDGKNWEHLSRNLPTDIVSALVVKPRGKLFAGTIGNGLFRSLAMGKSGPSRIMVSALLRF